MLRLVSRLLAVSVLVACSATEAPPSLVPSNAGTAAHTRYALRMSGYVASGPETPVSIQFALAESGTTNPLAITDFNRFTWITDGGGVSAVVDSVTSTPAGADHRLVTLASHAAALEPGEYLVTAIEYTDATGSQHQLQVGKILVDVREVPDPLLVDFPNHTVGQTHLQFIELSTRNISTHSITILGLHFTLPETTVASEMFLAGELQPADPTGQPQEEPPMKPIDSIVIEPGHEINIHFDLTPSDAASVRFSEIAPLLRLNTGSAEAFVPVPLQVYFGPFAGESDFESYLGSLPDEAHHPL